MRRRLLSAAAFAHADRGRGRFQLLRGACHAAAIRTASAVGQAEEREVVQIVAVVCHAVSNARAHDGAEGVIDHVAITVSDAPITSIRRLPPRLGEHTDEILAELGLGKAAE